MSRKNQLNHVSKFIAYVLGRRPDEFALLPDSNGYIKIKDLLKAVNEEPGWRHIRKAHLNEIFISLNNSPVQIKSNLIRAADRSKLQPPLPVKPDDLPKLLYTSIRMRGLAAAYKNGVFPMGNLPYILLTDDRERVLKLGKRYGQNPAVLIIHSAKVIKRHIGLLKFGETLYLAEYLPPECIDGPPIPKEKASAEKNIKRPDKISDKTPGSYFPDIEKVAMNPLGFGGKGKQKRTSWKRDKKRLRKSSIKKWPDE